MGAFGELIAARQKATRLRRSQLAERCGVRRQTIDRWVDSDVLPHLPNLPAIADAIGVPFVELATAWGVDQEDRAARRRGEQSVQVWATTGRPEPPQPSRSGREALRALVDATNAIYELLDEIRRQRDEDTSPTP